MELSYHSVVLFVKDIQESKRFYNELMSIETEMDMGENVILRNGITLWQVNKNHIIPRTVGLNKMKEKGHGFELCFETEDIKGIKSIVDAHHIPLVHELLEEPWGQFTFRVYDPDQNIVEIGETLKCFLARMKSNGLSNEEISRRTGMKTEDIARAIS